MWKVNNIDKILGKEILNGKRIYSSPNIVGFQMDNIICLVKQVDNNKVNMSFKHISRQ